MGRVLPKKNLGQHFIKDKTLARKIVFSLTGEGYDSVLEIGPGTGILTEILLERQFGNFAVVEIDNESVHYLNERFQGLERIIRGDFLKLDLESVYPGKIGIIGNFPYNISTQILFRILEYRDKVEEVCGMFQKEVAERVCASPGSRASGILSILIQAFYKAEYLFTVSEHVFHPVPKVKSGVVRLKRNGIRDLGCDEKLFFRVVKTAFNQRRKTLRNSIRSGFNLLNEDNKLFSLRPEQLSVQQFIDLTNWVAGNSVLPE